MSGHSGDIKKKILHEYLRSGLTHIIKVILQKLSMRSSNTELQSSPKDNQRNQHKTRVWLFWSAATNW